MKRTAYLEALYASLQYDTLVKCIYTLDERCAVHREAARVMNTYDEEVTPQLSLPADLPERRNCRVNIDRQLEVYDERVQSWKVVEPIEKPL